MSVFVCLLKYVSIPSNTNTNTTMGCSSNAFSLLSLCLSAWLAISLSLCFSVCVSFSVAHYSSIRRDCEFTAQVARDNKQQQMEKKGKQAQMSTSNRDRERKRGKVAQAVAIFTVVLHNFLAHYVD